MISRGELWQPLSKPPEAPEVMAHSRTTYWGDVWRNFRQHRLALWGLAIIALLIFMALIGPYLSGHTYEEQNYQMANMPPCKEFWFGTDALGRDLFTRVWYGARISLAVGFLTAGVVFLIGVPYGAISGYLGA